MGTKFNEQQTRLHQQLLVEINNQIDQSSSEYDAFKMHITRPVGGAGVLAQCKNLFDVFNKLAKRNKLGVLNYEVLKQALRDSNLDEVVSEIEGKEAEIRAAGNNDTQVTCSNTAVAGTNTSVAGTNAASTSKRQHEPLEYGDGPKVKVPKVQNESIDPSDGSFGEEDYPIKHGQKGYLLILNFEKDRRYTEIDVANLKQFFEKELGFDVDSPREMWDDDFTTEEIKERLEYVRTSLSDGYKAKRYYCFICVILSHGKQGVFNTRDGEFKIEDIRKMFSNKNMQNFAGKPKLFFIQACQGPGEQRPVQIDDEADDELIEPIDESDTLISIPNDADVLLVYATTPGYRAYRRQGMGSWFIKECVSVFQEFRKQRHIEDMLVTVRKRVALDWERHDKVKQMPCTWSTLTRRLRLCDYQS